MNPNTQFERDLEQWLQTEAPASAPAGFHATVMDRARTLRQRPGWATSLPIRRFGRGRGMTLLAAAALLLVGGALAAGSGLLRLPSVVPPVPAPSFGVLATASPDAMTTPTPSDSASPSPTALSLDLTWTQLPLVTPVLKGFADAAEKQSPRLAWIDDRFVLAEVKSGAVRTSTEGQDWQALQPGDAAQGYVDLLRGSFASWQDSHVGWWNPQEEAQCESCTNQPPITDRDVVQIVRPLAAPTSTTPFKGRIESIGIGPMGIVAQVHSDIDWDAWVTNKLGLRTNNDWTCCVKDVTFENGVLQIKLNNRPGLKVVWADEGLEPGDYQDRGFGWYSPDGEHWTAMAPNADANQIGSTLPTGGFGQVAGVSDGFIATGAAPDGACPDPDGSCTGMWYSSDGLTWRLLGAVPFESQELLPWRGGVLATDGDGHAEVWTSDGSAQLPIAAQLHGTVATGPLGIVSIGDGQVLVSRDGIGYKVSSIPAQMGDPANGGGGSTVVAVGDRTVLVHETRVGEFKMTQSLWLGTFEP
jgi:hypothetical protein